MNKDTNVNIENKNIAKLETPYLQISTFKLCVDRIPWLILLMLSATFTGLIISKHEDLLSSGVYGILLTSCIPMIMGTGGNAGGQSSATIIRSLALKEIYFKDFFKVVYKEFKVSMFLGFFMAVICFGKILLIDGILLNTEGVNILSSLVISLAMIITIIISKLIGCSLPLIAKKFNLDPAVIASPLITTIIDILSLVIYCKLAVIFL